MKKTTTLILSLSLVGALIAPSTQVFASDANRLQTLPKAQQTIGGGEITPNGTTGPSFTEFRTQYAGLGKTDLNNLKALADRAYKQDQVADYLSTAAQIMSYCNGNTIAFWSQVLGQTASWIKADLRPYETVSFCYDSYVYLDTHPSYSGVFTRFKQSRFFNGDRYTNEWHPIDWPVKEYYY